MKMNLVRGGERRARRQPTKCPCLYDAGAPICRADQEALRVPTQHQLVTLCTTGEHRGCPLYRRFLRSNLAVAKLKEG